MAVNIEKFKLESKVRLCYLKHRGDVCKVSEELNVPLELVKKIGKKFKKSSSRDVTEFVASSLLEHLLEGHSQRIQYVKEMLDTLDEKNKIVVSLCHGAPVKIGKERRTSQYVCLNCNKVCDVRVSRDSEVYILKMKLLELLREEDVALTDFSDKMGYTQKADVPVPIVRQNILVMDGESHEFTDMSAMEREKLRKGLEKTKALAAVASQPQIQGSKTSAKG